MTQIENNSFISSCKNYIIICAVFIVVAIVVALSCPSKSTQKFLPVVKAASEVENEVVAEFGALIHEVGFKSESGLEGLGSLVDEKRSEFHTHQDTVGRTC